MGAAPAGWVMRGGDAAGGGLRPGAAPCHDPAVADGPPE
jgi:hypothetical protein